MAAVTVTGDGPGTTTIDEKVVSRIVVAALESVPGSAGRRSGLGALTGRNYPRVDLSFDTLGDGVAVDAEIAVQWPAPVRAVAAASRDTVAEWLRRAVGARPVHVNVRVARVVTPEDGAPATRVTRGDLLAFDRDPRCRAAVAPDRAPVPVHVPRPPEVLRPQPAPAREPRPVAVVAGPAAPDGGVVRVAPPAPREPVEVRVPEPRPLTLVPTPRGPRMRDVAAPPPVTPFRPEVPAPRVIAPRARPLPVIHPAIVPGSGLPAARRGKETTR